MTNTPEAPRNSTANAWVPYVLPMFAFLLLTNFESSFTATGPGREGIPFPYAYGAKVVIVGCLTAISLFRFGLWRQLVPPPPLADILLAIGLGLLVLVLWVGLDGLYPNLPFMAGARTAFDPNTLPSLQKWIFLGERMFGLVVLVPIFEELFWRSFLIRYLIDSDFTKIAVGTVTRSSAITASALFGLAHPEWLPALLTGLLWAWLLKRTRSLGACVISHLVANLSLGLYVLATHQWKFW